MWMTDPEQCYETGRRSLKKAEREEVYRKAIDTYGRTEQLGVLIEELAELQKEICKLVFRGSGSLNHVAEEAADVRIMLEQLEIMFPDLKTGISMHQDHKVRRLAVNLKMEV